jgi:monofunctional biosynthetic peptidoglycan transglycosylase
MNAPAFWRASLRFGLLLAAAGIALQLYFLLRIVLMLWIDPQSTSFQRSEIYRVATDAPEWSWRQEWMPMAAMNEHLQRAVIASEDAGFVDHDGVEWAALEKARNNNERARARYAAAAEAAAKRAEARAKRRGQSASAAAAAAEAVAKLKPAKVMGASTISQQLTKNLFLSGERSLLRKGQELILTLAIEAILPKERILEIYLNSVEWGEGVFGADAAAQRYFKTSADKLSGAQAAKLAVMLPAPKRFEKTPNSGYISSRSQTILARMGDVQIP